MSGRHLAERLADYAAGLSYDDLPAEVVREVKRRVIDSIGCALGAFAADPCVAARGAAGELGRQPASTIIGTGVRTSPDLATMANGVAVRYLDYNDTYLSLEPAHPSDNIAAALAVAEAEGRGGRDLIAAIVLAYEVQCRLADAASIRARGWDHVTYGAFSTALAAGRLMGLGPDRLAQAVNLAGVTSPALRQTRAGELSMWKGAAFANSARNGVFAAYLARHGMTGPAPIFEGEMGFFQQVSGPFELPLLAGEDGAPPGGPASAGPASAGHASDGHGGFKIMESFLKRFPAEYHSQAGIEAALELRGRGVAAADVEEITILTFLVAVEIIAKDPEKWRPKTRETADHSLPYCVAAALTDGTISPAQFAPARIDDPSLQSLIGRVRVIEDPALTAQYPDGIPTILDVTLKSGARHSVRVDYPRGHYGNPMTDQEVEEKFRLQTQGLLAGDQQAEVLARAWELDRLNDVRALLETTGIR